MKLRQLVFIALIGNISASELQEESEINFAFYSSAWGENAVDGLRLVARNISNESVRLDSITFLKNAIDDAQIEIGIGLVVPPQGFADIDLNYVDLLQNNECIERTMAENWKLAEISNYTLNPSVRNLIIENTDSFRIYQCVESVFTQWTRLSDDADISYEEWVLYHFESRSAP